jgi:hypothetical protein
MSDHDPIISDTRAHAIADMMVRVRLASKEMRDAGRQTWALGFARNKLRVQAVSIQLVDIERELSNELRRMEQQCFEDDDQDREAGHAEHDVPRTA